MSDPAAAMSGEIAPERLLLLLGLSFFFGLAFEEFYTKADQQRPGGVRTFPLLALAGAGLYFVAPASGLAFAAGLLALGAWLYGYYAQRLAESQAAGSVDAELMVPTCNLLAFLLGPVAFLAPIWVSIGFTVIAVLLLGAREQLHDLAQRLPTGEMATAGKFLILTGIVLPLLPNRPVSSLTTITPYQVWLAVVVVSTLSYGSYLVQRYVWPEGGIWFAAILGGLYSSTATTVMLARRAGEKGAPLGELQTGIVLATALMYFRVAIVIAIFNLQLARAIALPLAILCALALVAALLCRWVVGGAGSAQAGASRPAPRNPLELSAALLFAAAFVVISLATAWAGPYLGQNGVLWLAAIVGVIDIDPFVLSLAQGGAAELQPAEAVAAILVAASSNNVLKAAYCMGFAGWRVNYVPALLLVALAVAGVLAAMVAG
jgi:uncharacterized membrane protein (DUF4010 family)